MSDGVKIGLILAGAGVVGFLLYEHSHRSAVAAGVPTIPGTGTALAAAPGTGSTSGGHTSITSAAASLAAKGVAFGVTTPIRAVSFGVNVVKDVGSDIYGSLKSIF